MIGSVPAVPPVVIAKGEFGVSPMLLIVSGPPLVFVSVTFCAPLVVLTVWAPNGTMPGVSVAVAPVLIPVAESVILFGLEVASLVTVRSAVCRPGTVGVNVTRIARAAPAGSVPAGCRPRTGTASPPAG